MDLKTSRLKMVCVMSEEAVRAMKGSRGKLGAMAGHAFLHAWWDADERFPDDAMAYRNSEKAFKVVLSCPNIDHLRALEESYSKTCGVSIVVDAGITVFDGPTTVCIGIGPIRDEDCGEDLNGLKVLQ